MIPSGFIFWCFGIGDWVLLVNGEKELVNAWFVVLRYWYCVSVILVGSLFIYRG